MTCRAPYLATTRAMIEGWLPEDDRSPCTNDVVFDVTCELAPGFTVIAEVCASHQYLIEANIPGTRSVHRRLRPS